MPVTLAILVLLIVLLLRAREIERDRRLACEIVPRLLYTRRTWKLRIANQSNSIMTLGEVVVSGRMATTVHAKQAMVKCWHHHACVECGASPSASMAGTTIGR